MSKKIYFILFVFSAFVLSQNISWAETNKALLEKKYGGELCAAKPIAPYSEVEKTHKLSLVFKKHDKYEIMSLTIRTDKNNKIVEILDEEDLSDRALKSFDFGHLLKEGMFGGGCAGGGGVDPCQRQCVNSCWANANGEGWWRAYKFCLDSCFYYTCGAGRQILESLAQ
jgi:hypothetical protein